MHNDVVGILACPACQTRELSLVVFRQNRRGEVRDGVIDCVSCGRWYPIEDYLLEFLTEELAYYDDRVRFYRTFKSRLGRRKLFPNIGSAYKQPIEQQRHFDWYAKNGIQSYTAYENTSFWRSTDRLVFDGWRRKLHGGGWLLDVGCAQGRSISRLLDLPLTIVAFDISKAMVYQAIRTYRSRLKSATVTFFVADASRFPIIDQSFDYVLIYGVLHHLSDPRLACREILRVLKHRGGIYFGLENNQTRLRIFFDLLQRLYPLWYEHAGTKPLIARNDFARWFRGSPLGLTMKTRTFLPPHIVNALPESVAHTILSLSDGLGVKIPFLRNSGGLIEIIGRFAA